MEQERRPEIAILLYYFYINYLNKPIQLDFLNRNE